MPRVLIGMCLCVCVCVEIYAKKKTPPQSLLLACEVEADALKWAVSFLGMPIHDLFVEFNSFFNALVQQFGSWT